MTSTRVVCLETGFVAFGVEHLVLIGIFLAGCVGFGMFGARMRHSEVEPMARYVLAVVVLVFTIPLQVVILLPDEFDMETSLPLQLCDLSWMVAVVALCTRSSRWSAVLYFWGLTLTTQAIVTPSLGETFPDVRYFMYWGMHFLIVWAAVYLTFGLRLRPSWSGYRFTVLCTAVWAVAMMVFNTITETNYGYLNRKPPVPSVLDLLGPWPMYVVAEIAIVCAGWALITWPWQRGLRREASRSVGDDGLPRSAQIPQESGHVRGRRPFRGGQLPGQAGGRTGHDRGP